MKTYHCSCGWLVHTSVTKTIKCPQCRSLIECQGEPKTAGLGDIIETILNYFGGKQFKSLYRYLLKRECGCNRRKTWLNNLGKKESV